ncbi:MAG: hypothetical protein GDA43_20405 [Hormoscilla sp. SP5CHS1]|nr:hypothetical protein [Hormoscilla sp. SP5CHS1]
MPKFQIHLYGSLISLGIHDILNLLQERFGVHGHLDMLELTFCYYTTISTRQCDRQKSMAQYGGQRCPPILTWGELKLR